MYTHADLIQHDSPSGLIHLNPVDSARRAGRREYTCTFITAGRVIRADQSESNWLIPAPALIAAAPMFEGIPSYLDHPELFGFGWHQEPQVKHLAGVTFGAAWSEEEKAIIGNLRLYDQNPYSPGALLGTLLDQILADKAAGLSVPPIGLSAVFFQSTDFDEEAGLRITSQIHYVESVDTVYSPGAHGYIKDALAALAAQRPGLVWPGVSLSLIQPSPQGETTMPEQIVTQPETTLTPSPPLSLPPSPISNQQISDPPIPARLDALESKLDAALAALQRQAQAHTITDNGPEHVVLYGGRSGLEDVEAAAEALLSGTRPPTGVRPLSGIRELYMLLSGDYELTGQFQESRVYLANVTTATMANIVANVLNKRVVHLYNTYPKWWEAGITEEDFASLQQIRWITLGGVGELPEVAEGAAYTELAWDDLAQRTSFEKKGGYLGITLETIDKDDTRKAQAAPRVLAQAAWLTLGKSIANIFTANSGVGPNIYYDDSNVRALFHSSNGNLGTSALSASTWEATRIAMMKQAEHGSGERLGALLRPRNMWVPIDLEKTGLVILASEGEPGTADNDINPEAEGEGRELRLRNARRRVITVPFWTSTTRWAAQADPILYPTIGVGYRFGREPEIHSVADPRAGLMFSNDTMPVKVRFFYAVGPMDYRGLYKHNV